MSFERFFHAVHGKDPFPWQVEAARRLVAGEELTAVSVPTACGKTALIDAAVFAAARVCWTAGVSSSVGVSISLTEPKKTTALVLGLNSSGTRSANTLLWSWPTAT